MLLPFIAVPSWGFQSHSAKVLILIQIINQILSSLSSSRFLNHPIDTANAQLGFTLSSISIIQSPLKATVALVNLNTCQIKQYYHQSASYISSFNLQMMTSWLIISHTLPFHLIRWVCGVKRCQRHRAVVWRRKQRNVRLSPPSGNQLLIVCSPLQSRGHCCV